MSCAETAISLIQTQEFDTHSDRWSEYFPDLAGELVLDERKVVPTVIQTACELGIDILGSCRLRSYQGSRREIPYNLIFSVRPILHCSTHHPFQSAVQILEDFDSIPRYRADKKRVKFGRIKLIRDDPCDVYTLSRAELGFGRCIVVDG
jgi:hypothetical protein